MSTATENEEPVATLDGTATSWTDTESTGLTGGYHSYEVAVKVNGAMSVKEQTQCGFVGPIAAAPLPWDPDIKTMSRKRTSIFSLQPEAADSEATGKWEFKESSWSGNNIQFYPKGKADDWLITPPLKSDKAGIYRFRINAKGTTAIRPKRRFISGLIPIVPDIMIRARQLLYHSGVHRRITSSIS